MLTEASVGEGVDPMQRTRLALASLRLRALQDELAAAEALAPGWDPDAARVQLRFRLDTLLEERRRALDDALAQVRAESAMAIASAYAQAAELAAGPTNQPRVHAAPEPVHPDRREVVGGFDPSTITVNFDTAALAAAIAAVLDSRPNMGYGAPTAAQAPRKKSFWSSLMHADVLMSLLGMIIVVAVLLAWAT